MSVASKKESQGILLDTHCWLWLLSEPERFFAKTLKLVSETKTKLYLSVASIWEISIKTKLGKLVLPETPEKYVPDRMAILGVQELPIVSAHALAAGQLSEHHSDPFDRLIIAQSQIENIHILTADKVFSLYNVKLLPL